MKRLQEREVKRALNEMKGSKAPGMDGVRVEMLKEGCVTVSVRMYVWYIQRGGN